MSDDDRILKLESEVKLQKEALNRLGNDKTWQTIFFELFELFFQWIVPGSVAVLLYFQPWADKVLKTANFMSALMYLILAWIAGSVLSVLSENLPKYLIKYLIAAKLRMGIFLVGVCVLALASIYLRVFPPHIPILPLLPNILLLAGLALLSAFGLHLQSNGTTSITSLELKFFKYPFKDLVNLDKENTPFKFNIQRRTHLASIIMFRGLAALSAISMVSSPEFHWPKGGYGTFASIGCLFVCLLSWIILKYQLTTTYEEAPGVGEQTRVQVKQ